jgi:hypothetical protein
MGLVLKVDSPEFLDAIHNLIHDCFFDVERISFDAEAGVLLIPFSYEQTVLVPAEDLHAGHRGLRATVARWFRFLRPARRTQVRLVPAILRIENVSDYSLVDTEHVGLYPFNILVFDPSSQVITVLTDIPLRFSIRVKGFAITVEIGSDQS